MRQGVVFRLARSVVIAIVVLTGIGIFMGPRARPLSPSADVPRFEDVQKRPEPPVARSEVDEDSLWGRIFNRVVYTFAEPQADALIFGATVYKVPRRLIHNSAYRSVQAGPFLGRLKLWTRERCKVFHRRIVAANINQFVLDRRLEVKYSPAPSDLPSDPKDTSSPVWRGPAGKQLRDAIVELVVDGRLALSDFGDMPFAEVVALLQPLPASSDTCP